MQRITSILLALFLCSFLVPNAPSQAAFWSRSQELAVINGVAYSSDDFKHWWSNWREKDQPLPETPEDFIEWHLLAQEAKSQQLDQQPAYLQKVHTFLKVRSLMMLKAELDRKIQVSDQEIRQRYQRDYAPLWQVEILFFPDRQQAARAAQVLAGKAANLKEFLASAEGKGVRHQRRRFRPIALKGAKKWQQVISGLAPGQVSAPFANGKQYVLVVLIDKKNPDDRDFQGMRKLIYQKLWKEKEDRLTLELVERLRDTYHVKVDQELYQKLDQPELDKDLLAKPLITSDRGQVPAGVIFHRLKTDLKIRSRKGYGKMEPKKLKRLIVNSMIAQLVTNWAALDRHFEKQPPFRWTYQFYQQNRLIKELENQLWQKVKVSDQQIRAYYEAHQKDFSRPGVVSMLTVESDDPALIRKLWLAVLQGKDFSRAAQELTGKPPVMIHAALAQVPEPWRQQAQQLAPGEVSEPLSFDGKSGLGKLLKRSKTRVMSLEHVRPKIVETLRQQEFQRLRKEFVLKLKKMSQITIHQDAWRALRKELGG